MPPITFWIDADGLVGVEATERRAGAAASIICKPTYELYEAEITRMIAGGRPEGVIECSWYRAQSSSRLFIEPHLPISTQSRSA